METKLTSFGEEIFCIGRADHSVFFATIRFHIGVRRITLGSEKEIFIFLHN